MKYLIRNPITSTLLAVCVVLLLTITFQWMIPYEAALPDLEADKALVEAGVNEATPPRYIHPHISNFSEITSRPIFFSNRQMPPEPVTAAAAPRSPLRLKLEGIAMTADDRVAILRDLGSNGLVQLTEGMTHDSWRLAEITSKTVTFRRDSDISELSLDVDSNK